jgi:hypothetical protein
VTIKEMARVPPTRDGWDGDDAWGLVQATLTPLHPESLALLGG